jgi:hypothetical protein
VDPALRLEGHITRISYELPAGLATLAFFPDYQQAMERAGFETIFKCSKVDCGV